MRLRLLPPEQRLQEILSELLLGPRLVFCAQLDTPSMIQYVMYIFSPMALSFIPTLLLYIALRGDEGLKRCLEAQVQLKPRLRRNFVGQAKNSPIL